MQYFGHLAYCFLYPPSNDVYRMRLNIRGTKLLRIANLLNIRGFYFHGCWE